VPLGCAIVVFLITTGPHFASRAIEIRQHFLGPVPAMSPIMAVVGSLQPSRPAAFPHGSSLGEHAGQRAALCDISRLDAVAFPVRGTLNKLGYLLAPIPLLAPCIFILLHIFVAFVQAFVFTLLPIVYVGGAVGKSTNSYGMIRCLV